MNKIKILPDEIINQIAAGEVLNRPSSAVKELVENSIDANSKKISIFVRDGGKAEIVVSDDGNGISKHELELAVTRHATSKLNEKKIDALTFLGFRGEALPSIASVSDTTNSLLPSSLSTKLPPLNSVVVNSALLKVAFDPSIVRAVTSLMSKSKLPLLIH